jgi:hypothetical protein
MGMDATKFLMDFSLILGDLIHFWRILGPFLGQILGRSWEVVTNFRPI